MMTGRVGSVPMVTVEAARQPKATPKVRADFAEALERRVDAFLGKPGSTQREVLDRAYGAYLEDGKFEVDKLPDEAKKELAKLQKASEDFEAHFIKGLMAQMRSVRFSEEDSAMTDFAKETMDQAIAEASARGQGSVGIAKNVFLTMGDQVIRQAVGRDLIPSDNK